MRNLLAMLFCLSFVFGSMAQNRDSLPNQSLDRTNIAKAKTAINEPSAREQVAATKSEIKQAKRDHIQSLVDDAKSKQDLASLIHAYHTLVEDTKEYNFSELNLSFDNIWAELFSKARNFVQSRGTASDRVTGYQDILEAFCVDKERSGCKNMRERLGQDQRKVWDEVIQDRSKSIKEKIAAFQAAFEYAKEHNQSTYRQQLVRAADQLLQTLIEKEAFEDARSLCGNLPIDQACEKDINTQEFKVIIAKARKAPFKKRLKLLGQLHDKCKNSNLQNCSQQLEKELAATYLAEVDRIIEEANRIDDFEQQKEILDKHRHLLKSEYASKEAKDLFNRAQRSIYQNEFDRLVAASKRGPYRRRLEYLNTANQLFKDDVLPKDLERELDFYYTDAHEDRVSFILRENPGDIELLDRALQISDQQLNGKYRRRILQLMDQYHMEEVSYLIYSEGPFEEQLQRIGEAFLVSNRYLGGRENERIERQRIAVVENQYQWLVDDINAVNFLDWKNRNARYNAALDFADRFRGELNFGEATNLDDHRRNYLVEVYRTHANDFDDMVRNQSIAGLNPLLNSMIDLTSSSYFPRNALQQIDLKSFVPRGWALYEKRFNTLLAGQKWEEAQALLPSIASYNRQVAPLMTIDPTFTIDRFEQRYTEGRFDQILMEAADAVNKNQHTNKFQLLGNAHQFYRQHQARIGADHQSRLRQLTNNTFTRTVQFIRSANRNASFIGAQEALTAMQSFYHSGHQTIFSPSILSEVKEAALQFYTFKIDHMVDGWNSNKVIDTDLHALGEMVNDLNHSAFLEITDLDDNLQHAYNRAIGQFVDQTIQQVENGRYDYHYAIEQLSTWQDQQPTYISKEVIRETQLYLAYLSGSAQGKQALASGNYQLGMEHFQDALLAYHNYPGQNAALMADLQAASTTCLSQWLAQKLSKAPLGNDDHSKLQYYGDLLALREKYNNVRINLEVEEQLVPVKEAYYELACAALQQEIQEYKIRAQQAIDQKRYVEAKTLYDDALTKVQEGLECGMSTSDLRESMKATADAAYFQETLQKLGLDAPRSDSKTLFDQYEVLWTFYQEQSIKGRFGLDMPSLFDYVSSTTHFPFHHQFIVRYCNRNELKEEVKSILKRIIQKEGMASEAALKQTAIELVAVTYAPNLGKNYKSRFKDFAIALSDKSAKKRFKGFEKAFKKAWKGME